MSCLKRHDCNGTTACTLLHFALNEAFCIVILEVVLNCEKQGSSFWCWVVERNQVKIMQSRPEVHAAIITDKMNDEEIFQNKVLRPIIKGKHEILIAIFNNYIASNKRPWNELSDLCKMDLIENAVSRDLTFRNILLGVIIGQFTIEEYQQYITIARGSNKRINNIVKERMISHLDVLCK